MLDSLTTGPDDSNNTINGADIGVYAWNDAPDHDQRWDNRKCDTIALNLGQGVLLDNLDNY